MLKKREFGEQQPEKKRAGINMKSRRWLPMLYALFFGVLSGVIITVALSFFVPEFYTAWTGSLVCPGRVEYVTFKQTYYCYAASNSAFDLGSAMFWAIFKRFIFIDIAAGFLFALGFMKLGEFLYQRREAAGF